MTGAHSSSASWRRWLMIPSVVRLGAQAPRDPALGWDQYWAEINTTGDGGDVLWDTASRAEINQYLSIALEHLDPTLPVVDVGCGNGRQARILSHHFPAVVGVDLSPPAIQRAQAESAGIPNLSFHTLDILAPDAATQLLTLAGEANVFVRGVFHVLPPAHRLRMAANLRPVLGRRGHLFLAETNYRGDALGYLHHLGARQGQMPLPLQRAISRIPKPRPFGATERAHCMPEHQWIVETDGDTTINTIALQHNAEAIAIPGYYAVIRPRPPGLPRPRQPPDQN